MNQKVSVLFDTDIGSDVDDPAALAYLLAQPRCDLVGVTTVTGRSDQRAMLADALCRAAGGRQIPVVRGLDRPILVAQRQLSAPQAEVLSHWPHRDDLDSCEAVSFLRETIRSRPGEMTLLTVGPLTNVGLLFAVDPEIPALLKELVMMAGVFFDGDGLEWNATGDPHATAVVFSVGVPRVRVHGLDVTTRCRLAARECRQRFRGGPLDLVLEMAEVFFRGRDAITFHDPLAAAAVFEPDLCTYRPGTVEVALAHPDKMGRTVLKESPEGRHLVADGVNAEGFFDHYFRVVETFRSRAS